MDAVIRSSHPDQLDVATVYRILRLRVDVFVVEQQCAYPELDGRDLEPGTRWVWAEVGDEVVATLRLLIDPNGRSRIGRVATARAARSAGVASMLLEHTLGLAGPGTEIVLGAQAYLEGWYERFGFTRSGAAYIEDGIPHVPMVLTPAGG